MVQKLILFLFVIGNAYSQNSDIKIADETKNNRISVYALNESQIDYDVKIKITGKNIRQSAAKPRFIRVPSATKVLLKTLIIERKKQPSYTYELIVNDSLSRRVLKPHAEPIKINPKKQIILYVSDNCITCDSILKGLNNGKFKFSVIDLTEKPDVKARMKSYLEGTIPSVDTLTNPIISLGGVLHTKIDSYNLLMEKLNKEN